MKTLLTLAFAALVATFTPAASAALRINEVHSNPPGTDYAAAAAYEYIEVISNNVGGVESTNTYWLLLLDTDGGNMGRVDAAWSLNGMATGTNGILLLGVNYAATGGGPWAGKIAPGTALGSISIPAGKDGLIEPNRAWSILLVKNFTGTAGPNGTDASSNDTAINAGIQNNLQDSVGLNEHFMGIDPLKPPTPIVDVSQTTYSPGNVSRIAGNFDIKKLESWFGGEVVGSSGLSVTFDPTRRFGAQANPVATPGAPNTPPVPADIRINEVEVNPGGPDGNNEYVELIKVGGAATTGQGYHLLVINTDNSSDTTCFTDRSIGVIVEDWDLSQVEFGTNGLALLGNDYDDGLSPWRNHVDPATVLSDVGTSADPDGVKLGNNDIGNEIHTREAGVCTLNRTNAGFTLLLVKDFTGSALQDLDANDDGVLDLTPWSSIVDSVGYAGATPTYAPADVTQAGYQPDNISRIAGNTTGNSAAAFYGGNHPGESPLNISFGSSFFGGFRGESTPGRTNLNAPPAIAPLVINEVNFHPPGDSAEFIELKSTGDSVASAHGYTLLTVATGAANRGEVLHSYDLSGYSTGPNGLLLMGQNFDPQAATIFPDGTIRPETAVESGPPGFVAGDLPDQDFALLLVTGFSGSPGLDLDTTNDGVIDAGIGFTIVDGVSFGLLSGPAVTDLSGHSQAGNASRTGSGPAGWYGGAISGVQPGGLAYDPASAFGSWVGKVTPGQGNLAGPIGAGTILLNEANINPPGDDLNFDYVELLSSSIAAQSTNDLTLILIDTSAGDDGLGNVGEISRVWSLDALATGRNGLLLLGDGYTSPPGGPFATAISPLTNTADPIGMNSDALASDDGFALLLVRGFSGKLGQDLDSTNDGILDSTPWTQVVDAIVFGDVDYGFPDLSQGTYHPDNLSRGGRFADLLANNAARWYGGAILGTVSTGVAFDLAKRFDNTGAVSAGAATPGTLNLGGVLDDEVDNDLDGLANLMEKALATNPGIPDAADFPTSSLLNVGGQNYLALTFSRVKGGTGSIGDYTAGGIRNVVQVSNDLSTWTPAGSGIVQVSVTDDGNGISETVVVRLVDPSISGNGPRFLRLKANRP